ncbi:HNH endonuclease [Shewanella sp. GutCb]|uniref:HNH endonuclease n=1 Tax=Shewanella sp. GutCb TaxID=2058315 RepID=UPI000C7A5D0E|nr:HNH endonuclease [Shewanella sp. GutCb]PKG73074.1 HNH endonuclease [Shewanella sp. GutCb]
MVQNEFEYIEFLVQGRLQDNSAYSYGRYLEAVSRHLEINLNRSTVTSERDVKDILNRLSETDLAERYKNNCGTALRAYLRFLGQVQPDFSYPDEILNPENFVEGAKKQVTVNSYERDRVARDKAIEIHGLNCFVCEMSFENVYGEIGIGFIHIHHLTPLHEIGDEYQVSSEDDLVPVCPNCHAMLHRTSNPPTIEQLKDVIRKQKSI